MTHAELESIILDCLNGTQSALTMDEIVVRMREAFPTATEFEVKEAVWNILSEQEAELTPQMCVSAVSRGRR